MLPPKSAGPRDPTPVREFAQLPANRLHLRRVVSLPSATVTSLTITGPSELATISMIRRYCGARTSTPMPSTRSGTSRMGGTAYEFGADGSRSAGLMPALQLASVPLALTVIRAQSYPPAPGDGL